MNREAEIRGIAYQLWEKEGRPQGRDVEFWQKAEAIWQEGLVQQATPPKPKATSQEAETAKVRARPKRARR